MKNILAENMRRFRTKNLNEQNEMPTPEPDALVAPNRKLEQPAEPKRITKLTDITDGNKFNLFKDAGAITTLYTGTIVDAKKLQTINDGRVLFDINIQGVGIKTIGWSGSLSGKQEKNPNANQFLFFKNNNDAHAWYNGDGQNALRNTISLGITGTPVVKGATFVYNDTLGKFLKAHHGQASYDPTAAN
jgi:hypothetical protein